MWIRRAVEAAVMSFDWGEGERGFGWLDMIPGLLELRCTYYRYCWPLDKPNLIVVVIHFRHSFAFSTAFHHRDNLLASPSPF